MRCSRLTDRATACLIAAAACLFAPATAAAADRAAAAALPVSFSSVTEADTALSAADTLTAPAYPERPGSRLRCGAMIEMERGYLSGVLILLNDTTQLKGCLFNEFGVSALDFVYLPQKHRVRIVHAAAMIDRWYIRRTLRADLLRLIEGLRQGRTRYDNTRRRIRYSLTPLADDTEG